MNDQVGRTSSWRHIKKDKLPYRLGKFLSRQYYMILVMGEFFIEGFKKGWEEAMGKDER